MQIRIDIMVILTVGAVPHSSCEQSVKNTPFAKVHKVSKHRYVATIHVLCDAISPSEAQVWRSIDK